MIQRFIELGEGYSDLYELLEIAKTNEHRLAQMLAFHTKVKDKDTTSLAVVLTPAEEGNFQPIYICREGIPNPNITPNKRFELFTAAAAELGKKVIQMDVKPSNFFAEKELFFQYLIGILRLNHLIPPLK
ncbi:DUF7147 family protein [Falsibacillus pallidus]|uniref:DUF7147 domain-containing protein n=1 Tax=Falsibacillus pallidus TaxID=493781 RepID=A0A370GWD7_9BACI|nr:methylthioribose kinase [Falsibacillus pallidus]RDI47576.1 hypothetical protein DFR59_101235 [Falsibacillus pallidus]